MDEEWTPYGQHSYYVTLSMSTAIVAKDESEAKEVFQKLYVKEMPSTGWESYGTVEWKIIPGPPLRAGVIKEATDDG